MNPLNAIMIWRQETKRLCSHKWSRLHTISIRFVHRSAIAADTAPAGRYTPINGFGKVWNGEVYFGALIRDKVGWATAPEQHIQLKSQATMLLLLPSRLAYHNLVTNGRTVDMGSAFGS